MEGQLIPFQFEIPDVMQPCPFQAGVNAEDITRERRMEMERMTLRAIRVNLGLTQTEASKRIGVTTETLCNWEQAKTFPNVPQIQKIENAYDVRYADIIFCPSISV